MSSRAGACRVAARRGITRLRAVPEAPLRPIALFIYRGGSPLPMADTDNERPAPWLPSIFAPDEALGAPDEDTRAGYRPPRIRIDKGAKKNLDFLNAMTPKEAEKYMGQWIAVYDGEIVAHCEGPHQVCQEGRKAGKGSIYIRYIYAKPEEVPWLYVPK